MDQSEICVSRASLLARFYAPKLAACLKVKQVAESLFTCGLT